MSNRSFAIAMLFCLPGCQAAVAPPTPTPRAEGTPTSLNVATSEAKLEPLHPKIELSGMVNPTEEGSVAVTTPMDGVVIKPLVKVGDFVTQGQALADLNSVFGQTGLQVMTQLESLQVTMREAEKNLTAAQTSLAQARTTLGQSFAAVSSANSALGQAEAELNAARSDLRRKTELERAGVFAKADVDEARDRAGKAESIFHDAQNQVVIDKRLIPYNQRSVAQLEVAVAANQRELSAATAAYERNGAVLLQGNLVGSSLPRELRANLQGSGVTSSAAQRASQFSLKAPVSGVVSDLSLTPGLKIMNGTAVGNVTDVRQVYVDANVFETDVALVHDGDSIECTSLAYPNEVFQGHVKYISRRVQSDTRAIVVRTLIDNRKQLLKPSMYVKVKVNLPTQTQALTVPTSAILTEGDDLYVIVQKAAGKFKKRKVTIGAAADQKTQILTGLKPGETVVTQGNLLLNSQDHQD